jgi:hypothetical protein
MKSHLLLGRASGVLTLAASLLLAPGAAAASADTCILGSVDCVTSTVGQVVDDGSGTHAVVDDATDTATDAVSAVGDAVPTPVDEITDPVVEEIVSTLGNDRTDPTPGPAEDQVVSAGGLGDGTEVQPPGDPTAAPVPKGRRHPEATLGVRRRDLTNRASAPSLGVRAEPSSDDRPPAPAGADTGPGGSIHAIANALRFPVVLVALILLFLVFHQRADRRDPKLAAAPVRRRPETLGFR